MTDAFNRHAVHMVEHVNHRDPSPTITAPRPVLRMYTACADQNRVSYFAQSAATRGGKVAPFDLAAPKTGGTSESSGGAPLIHRTPQLHRGDGQGR